MGPDMVTGTPPYDSTWYHCHFDRNWLSLFQDAPVKRYEKNEVIYREGEVNRSVYLLLEGRVRLFLSDKEGNEKTIIILNPGSLFGESCALEGRASLVTALTNTPSLIASLPYDQFLHRVLSNPALSEKFIYNLSHKLNAIKQHIREIVFFSAPERIVNYLAKLARVYGEETDEGRRITIKFTHQEMADLSGVSRVTVSNVMACLERERVIKKKGGYYYITNLQFLEKMINKEKEVNRLG